MGTLQKRRRRTAALALPIVIGVSLAAIVVSNASPSAGCGNVEGPIIESDVFTPIEGRRSLPMDPPINPSDAIAPPVPAEVSIPAIAGLPLRWATVSANGAVYQYFLASELGPHMTVSDFYAAGGLQLDRDPVENGESFAEYLLSLSQRAVRVEVGEHVGALNWADPNIKGTRLHHLYWSDGAYNYAVYTDRSAEEILSIGRGLVCGGLI